ncbi:wu:fc21g02 isoform X2 [Neoarius graeffei]|nr:wu:fc21g02 isoform X2 [Neoarius graeffei]
MQGFWILLLAALTYSCATLTKTKTYRVELMYGKEFTIKLPVGSEKLTFISADSSQKNVLWDKYVGAKRGSVTGRDDDKKFTIRSVTFEDEGTYSVLNFWDKKAAIYLLKIIPKTGVQNCVAGENLRIDLSGLSKNDATLHFSSQYYNLTLVERGSPVGNLHAEYLGRITLTSTGIDILNVNVSDVGNYTLTDRLNRKVKIISMVLVDHHGVNGAPFMGLLMLLGIPPCIFCCCRKRICKKRNQPTNTTTTTVKFDNQINPPGPPPAYNPAVPSGPTPAYTPGYPAGGENIVHPPPNPTFPPQPPYSGYPAPSPAFPPNPAFNPAYPPVSGFPPAQPPQWSGAPYNQPAPADFAPVMYNAPTGPEPVKGEMTPVTPLLTPPQPEVAQPPAPSAGDNVLHSSDFAVHFNINTGKDSNPNFL